MSRILWLALGLTLCMVAQGEVSIRYTDCPKDCKCVKNVLASITCKTMFTNYLAVDMPITHFELNGAEEPVTLTENIFVKMGLTRVNVISISNSKIKSIDKNAFKGLPSLTQIEIINSSVSNLHPDTFKGIANLKTLKLSDNPLSNDVVINSKTLEQLVLSGCKLSDISERLFENIPAIIYLDLSYNDIEALNKNSFETLMNLQEINLSFNHLKEIPEDLFVTNDFLDTLNLSNNPISSFSGEEFEDLETLDLSNCLIRQIDAAMFKNMMRLNNLDISYNKIANIDPKSFVDMTELKVIDLSGNELHLLDENVFAHNNNLQRIRLDNNIKLSKLPDFNAIGSHFAVHYFSCNNCNLRVLSKYTFKHMPAILTLLLAHNNINDISTGAFQNLTSLIDLDLAYNEIITIDDDTFKYNTDLQTLTLSFNPLKALHATMFKENINLKILELSSCGLYKLWTAPTALKLPSVVSLNISNNNIKIITNEDVEVTDGLKYLDISKNPLDCKEDLKDLIIYLSTHSIKNKQYLTHEKQSYDFEERDKNVSNWKEIVRARCPDLLPDNEEDELDDFDEDNFGDATKSDIIYDTDLPVRKEIKIYQEIPLDEDDEEEEEILLPLKHNAHYRYSLMWPVLIFLGTALAVLGLVANVILFVIRRKQSIPVPRIINVPKISSRLKTNSGLVYQQLSEEHGPKTPILGRFTPIVGVQGNQNDVEHV